MDSGLIRLGLAMARRGAGVVFRIFFPLVLCTAFVGLPPSARASDSFLPRVPQLCFAPGTPLEWIEQTEQQAGVAAIETSLHAPGLQRSRVASRWWGTATDGGGLSQGDPITLTWSVLPDGTSIPTGGPDPTGPSNLRAFLTNIYSSEAEWRQVLRAVFDRWGELTGITYVEEPNDDGAAFPGSPGVLGARGDIRIGGHFIDGNYGILAYNYFPDSGDMVLDTGDAFYYDTTSNSLRLRNTLAHEHGHGLGLSHVCPMDQTKLMEPMLSTRFDGPQHDDILGANRSYGDVNEANDSPTDGTDLGALPLYEAANLSIDDLADTDVYRFSVAASSRLDVTVTPVGWTYLEGPQAGDCSAGTSFDSLTLQDLALDVLDTDGSSVLDSIDINPAGSPEELVGTVIPGPGEYFVRVRGDTLGKAQLYRLDLAVTVDSNGCNGDNPVISETQFVSPEDVSCTGNASITLGANTEILSGARLMLTAPQVRWVNPVRVEAGGQLHIVTPTTVVLD